MVMSRKREHHDRGIEVFINEKSVLIDCLDVNSREQVLE